MTYRWWGQAAADAAALAVQAPGAVGEPLHPPRARRVLRGVVTRQQHTGVTRQHTAATSAGHMCEDEEKRKEDRR